jgi:hypothetical protein
VTAAHWGATQSSRHTAPSAARTRCRLPAHLPACSCSVYAYPWYTSVRTILEDPAYSDWFIKFKPTGPYKNPQCDNNYNPPLCSTYFHMQVRDGAAREGRTDPLPADSCVSSVTVHARPRPAGANARIPAR